MFGYASCLTCYNWHSDHFSLYNGVCQLNPQSVITHREYICSHYRDWKHPEQQQYQNFRYKEDERAIFADFNSEDFQIREDFPYEI